MSTKLTASQLFKRVSGYSSADCYARPASEVYAGAIRLESGFYGSEGYRAVRAMKKSGFQLGTVGQFAAVRWFGPFARTYVADHTAGVAFLSSADMMCAKLEPKNYLSKALTQNLERLLVSDETILISCSGTIGNVVICSKDYNGVAVSQHAIRVSVLDKDDMGFLYAFLQSEPGQFLVTRNKSGSVIESIYEADVSSLAIPILPKKLRHELTRLIREAKSLRVKANKLLGEAEAEVKTSCNLPDLEDLKPDNLIANDGEATTFICSSAQRLAMNGQFGTLRMDATYHDPTACALSKHILSQTTGTTLGKILHEVRRSSLRQRYYVDTASQGVPIIGGKQLMQLRPNEIKFLSKTLTRNIKAEKVEKNWVLVSCGGTIGRALLVHRNYEGWCASEHVMRLVPDQTKIFPGFLYAFLSSPYGEVQIDAQTHGSVIIQIRDFEFETIAIPLPKDRGESIHNKVIQAFDARADARLAEDKAIELFMSAIRDGKDAVESSWGRDY
ncbi:MAG: restriction endonuclease subunit S [Desulfobacter sp.]